MKKIMTTYRYSVLPSLKGIKKNTFPWSRNSIFTGICFPSTLAVNQTSPLLGSLSPSHNLSFSTVPFYPNSDAGARALFILCWRQEIVSNPDILALLSLISWYILKRRWEISGAHIHTVATFFYTETLLFYAEFFMRQICKKKLDPSESQTL